MKHLAVLGAMTTLVMAIASPAPASICNLDVVPAATLLLPYFEVNLDDPNGLTTLVSVNNSSAQAVLAHMTIWSDLSVPVLAFNIYLTGFDVQTINLRDILVTGTLPQTASAGQDPNDTISPKGSLSQDVNFASCTGQLPPPPLPASFIQHLQLSLTGRGSPIFSGQCAGQSLGDNVARGYITFDTVSNCTLRDASNPAYFTGDLSFQNVLWGDYAYVNTTKNFANGGALVHIEASTTEAATTTAGRYTFYGRYVGWNASDHREPLATNFGARYATGGTFDGGTSFVVWRDPKTVQLPFVCPAALNRPSWFPLTMEGLDIFDEQEHLSVPTVFPCQACPPLPLVYFPAATQRTVVDSVNFPVPFLFGWVLLNLNSTVPGSPFPPVDPAAAQAWVIYDMDSNGHFSVGYEALRLDSACAPNHGVP